MKTVDLILVLFIAVPVLAMEHGCSSGSGNRDLVAKNETGISDMDKQLKYLALGDSYTIGESVTEEARWPVQLADSLRTNGVNIADPLIIARTGWTTDELMEGISAVSLTGDFDLVTLLIGVNNQYRGRDIENFRVEFRKLLGIATGLSTNGKDGLVVLSIPDWGVMPFAEGRDRLKIASEIDAYNEICKEESDNAGIRFFDITTVSREAAFRPDLVADDGLHPSGKMYHEWVKIIYSEINETLTLK